MFLINRLEEITKIVVDSVGQIALGPVQIIDNGDGMAFPKFAASYPLAVATVLRLLAETTGVDVTALLGQNGSAPRRWPAPIPTPSAPTVGPGSERAPRSPGGRS